MEGELRARHLDRRNRHTRLGTQAGMAFAAILLAAGVAPSVAWAAPGASPDAAPQAAPPSSSSGSPSPDPAPQASPAQPSSASPSSGAPIVVPQATSSGIAAASPSTGGESQSASPVLTMPAARALSPVKRSARARSVPVRPRASWVATAIRLTLPWRHNPFELGAAARLRSAAPAKNGLLLLFGSLALAVLALASASMLRLLRGMEEVTG